MVLVCDLVYRICFGFFMVGLFSDGDVWITGKWTKFWLVWFELGNRVSSFGLVVVCNSFWIN